MAAKILNIGVIGGTEAKSAALQMAFEAGREIALRNYVLYCGGRGGVMESASRGACENKGVVIGILPGFDRAEANPYVTYSIPTGLGHLRNQVVVCSSDVVLAFEGSAGTLSEIALAAIYQKPVLSIGSWDLPMDPLTGKPVFAARFDAILPAMLWLLEYAKLF
ncbi:MAG: TIGR00725 family protein [Spirochaetales bacterium]|nr:TIGR00725 family protein [Spirochaetales bacterium]